MIDFQAWADIFGYNRMHRDILIFLMMPVALVAGFLNAWIYNHKLKTDIELQEAFVIPAFGTIAAITTDYLTQRLGLPNLVGFAATLAACMTTVALLTMMLLGSPREKVPILAIITTGFIAIALILANTIATNIDHLA